MCVVDDKVTWARDKQFPGPGSAEYSNPAYVAWRMRKTDEEFQARRDKMDAAMWRMHEESQKREKEANYKDAEFVEVTQESLPPPQ